MRKFLTILLATVLIFACKKQNGAETVQDTEDIDTTSAIAEKAQKVYNKQGMDKYVAYVEKNGYYPVVDEARESATPFLIAVGDADVEKTDFFLSHGANLSEADKAGKTALDYAFENANANTEILRKLVASGQIQWNNPTYDGTIPAVRFITDCSDFELVKQAIDFTGNNNWKNSDGKSLLMYAAQSNVDVRTVKYFLDKGVSVSERNSNEWSAVMYAARYNPNPAVLEDLIMRQADLSPNSVGLTLTMLAACNPNPGVLFTLFKYVDEVNATTDRGKTALMYACENKQPSSVLKLLFDAGSDIQAADADGKTALMYAVQNYTDVEPVYFLIASGADTVAKDNSDRYVKDYFASNAALKDTDLKNALDVARPVNQAAQKTNDIASEPSEPEEATAAEETTAEPESSQE